MTTPTSNIHQMLQHLIPKIKASIQSKNPVIQGITGFQGSGKSTWSNLIVNVLSEEHNLRIDLYKTHDDLVVQREKDVENRLYRTRGQPGTHDEALAGEFFGRVKELGG
jgi:D-glycerate 3-kinase